MLGLPGTSSSIGAVSLDLSILSEAIDVAAQSARTQITRDRNIQFSNRTIWMKGKHNVSFGGEFRVLPFLFNHNDQVNFSYRADRRAGLRQLPDHPCDESPAQLCRRGDDQLSARRGCRAVE